MTRSHLQRHPHRPLSSVGESYDPDHQVNLPGYTGSLLAFTASTAALGLLARRHGRALPQSYAVTDLVIGGLATHKFSRLLSKGAVTSPVRAPFTEFDEPAGASEHNERARGEHGLRHTVGELLTCPFCVGQWVSTGYVVGLALAPRATRTWAAVFAVSGLSDTLQHAYARLRAA